MKIGIFRYFLLLALGLFGFQACTWMSADTVSALRGQSAVKREEVKLQLRTAILLNGARCSANYDAALYAVEEVVTLEVSEPFYTEASMSKCFLAIWMTPCDLGPEASSLVYLNMYSAVIRSCGLHPVKI